MSVSTQPDNTSRKRGTMTMREKREKEFQEALNRIYRKYGNNLSAFLRDVQREKELVKRG
jgi:hypothetical protein